MFCHCFETRWLHVQLSKARASLRWLVLDLGNVLMWKWRPPSSSWIISFCLRVSLPFCSLYTWTHSLLTTTISLSVIPTTCTFYSHKFEYIDKFWTCIVSKRSILNALSSTKHRLVGLVITASASGAEDPRFSSSLRQGFSGSSLTSGHPVRRLAL